MNLYGCTKDLDDYKSIMAKAVADRLAEALSESCMKRCVVSFGDMLKNENLTDEQIIFSNYRGIRPAPATRLSGPYGKNNLLKSLMPLKNTGIILTENFA